MLNRQVIQDHISLYWGHYAAVAVMLGLWVLVSHFGGLHHGDRLESRNWPVTTAQIIESEIDELPAGKYSVNTRAVVLLMLRYEVAGRTYVEHCTGNFSPDTHTSYASL